MKATRAQIEAAFTEWDRRYREDPDRFLQEWESAEFYGSAAMTYFCELVKEIQAQD